MGLGLLGRGCWANGLLGLLRRMIAPITVMKEGYWGLLRLLGTVTGAIREGY